MIIVSACLAGENCRYDARSCSDSQVVELIKNGQAIAVCPEQLAGLSTPRPPAEAKDSKVFTNSGEDITEEFKAGAQRAMSIVKENQATHAILKERSPMCGVHNIYDGTFSGILKKDSGVFTKLLKEAGIEIESRK